MPEGPPLAGLEKFRRSTLRTSEFVDNATLDRWLESRKTSETRRSRPDEPELPPHPGPKELLSYQREVAQEAGMMLSAGRSCLLSLPTGSGKTFTAIRIVFAAIAQGQREIVWLAPQRILVEQALDELRAAWWGTVQPIGLSIVGDLSKTATTPRGAASIRFGTIQMALSRFPSTSAGALIVIDEAHFLQANEFGRLARRLRGKECVLLGLTATPGRRDSRELTSLQSLFDSKLVVPESLGTEPIETLQERGVYSRISFEQLLPRRTTVRERAQVNKREIPSPSVAALSSGRLDATIGAFRESDNRQAVVFCHSIAQCYVYAAGLSDEGAKCAVVGSNEPLWHNRLAIREFREGNLNCLLNAKYLAVGADLPSASKIYLTVPIGSPILFEQIVGRVARGPAVGGTEHAVVYEFDAHRTMHSALRSYARFKHEWSTI